MDKTIELQPPPSQCPYCRYVNVQHIISFILPPTHRPHHLTKLIKCIINTIIGAVDIASQRINSRMREKVIYRMTMMAVGLIMKS